MNASDRLENITAGFPPLDKRRFKQKIYSRLRRFNKSIHTISEEDFNSILDNDNYAKDVVKSISILVENVQYNSIREACKVYFTGSTVAEKNSFNSFVDAIYERLNKLEKASVSTQKDIDNIFLTPINTHFHPVIAKGRYFRSFGAACEYFGLERQYELRRYNAINKIKQLSESDYFDLCEQEKYELLEL